MRLLETIEDGSKAAVFWEDVSPEDVEAIHAYQTAGGEGVLTVRGGAIRYGQDDAPAKPVLTVPIDCWLMQTLDDYNGGRFHEDDLRGFLESHGYHDADARLDRWLASKTVIPGDGTGWWRFNPARVDYAAVRRAYDEVDRIWAEGGRRRRCPMHRTPTGSSPSSRHTTE